jgi:hypothetical protein
MRIRRSNLLGCGWVIVVKYGSGAKLGEIGVILGAGGGNNLVAYCSAKLDGPLSNTGASGPDQECRRILGNVHWSLREVRDGNCKTMKESL